MKVAKGQIQLDNMYIYTCGNCNGVGFFSNEVCPHCYNLDYERLTQEFKTARGSRYYALLKAILSVSGKAIADEFIDLKSTHGKLSPVQMGYLTLRFGMNFTALGEWLEECRLIPSGMTLRVKERGTTIDEGTGKRRKVKVADILEAGESWHQATYDKPIELWKPALMVE